MYQKWLRPFSFLCVCCLIVFVCTDCCSFIDLRLSFVKKKSIFFDSICFCAAFAVCAGTVCVDGGFHSVAHPRLCGSVRAAPRAVHHQSAEPPTNHVCQAVSHVMDGLYRKYVPSYKYCYSDNLSPKNIGRQASLIPNFTLRSANLSVVGMSYHNHKICRKICRYTEPDLDFSCGILRRYLVCFYMPIHLLPLRLQRWSLIIPTFFWGSVSTKLSCTAPECRPICLIHEWGGGTSGVNFVP